MVERHYNTRNCIKVMQHERLRTTALECVTGYDPANTIASWQVQESRVSQSVSLDVSDSFKQTLEF